jgi:hypothetical protein
MQFQFRCYRNPVNEGFGHVEGCALLQEHLAQRRRLRRRVDAFDGVVVVADEQPGAQARSSASLRRGKGRARSSRRNASTRGKSLTSIAHHPGQF